MAMIVAIRRSHCSVRFQLALVWSTTQLLLASRLPDLGLGRFHNVSKNSWSARLIQQPDSDLSGAHVALAAVYCFQEFDWAIDVNPALDVLRL
jgi:hypothetical protein